MRNMVKLSFIASVLLLISCSSDFPPAPEFKFCVLNGCYYSVHKLPEKDCETVGGRIIFEPEGEACKD
ncbi:MAG: hypothetical protein FWF63_02005 [Fibromonadales bacterium]|nr:hypothetical protein [Fibromonadales bacterium]